MKFRRHTAVRSSNITKVTNMVIVAVVIAFGFYAVAAWQQVKSGEEQHMQSNLVPLARTLDMFFLSKRAGMLTLADAIEQSPAGLNDLVLVQKLLANYQTYRPEISLTFVTDMSGQFLASTHTRSLKNLPTLADQPAFQEFLREHADAHDVYIGRAQVEKLTQQWAFSMRYILRDRHGKPLAVLTDVFPTDFLESFWKDIALVRNVTVGLLRDDGHPLTRYPLPPAVSKDSIFGAPDGGALYQQLKRDNFPVSGRVVGPDALSQGDDFINLFQRLERFPLTVFVAQPQRQIVRAWRQSVITPLALVCMLLGFVKFTSLRFERREREVAKERAAAEEALRTSDADQRFLIDRLMTGLVIHDATGAVMRCNIEATDLLGLSSEQMNGKQLVDPAWHFLNEDGSPMLVSEYPVSRVLVMRQAVKDLVLGVVRSEGSEPCWVLCRADPWFKPSGDIDKIVVTFFDITLRRKLLSERRDRELKFEALFENSMDAVMMTRPDGVVMTANRAACQLFGLSEAEIKARGRFDLVDLADPRLQELLDTRQELGRAAGTITMIRGDGSRFEAEITSSTYDDSLGGTYSSMIVRDISERLRSRAELEAANLEMQRINQQLAEVAHFDMLTHLPNRVLLADRLQQAMAHCARRNKSLAVAFLDLDGFKEINDQYGHATGDEFLVKLSGRLKSALRDGDTLARIGGDEFVAVMTDLAGEADCEPLLARLCCRWRRSRFWWLGKRCKFPPVSG